MGTVEVTLARDARIHHHLYPETELVAVLRGRIVRRTSRSSKLKFFVLRDVTEGIQILVSRADVTTETWDGYCALREGDGVEVRGRVGLAKSGRLSILPTAAPIPLKPLSVADLLNDEFSGVGTQMLLARLENRCRNYLTESGFIELAPRYLSNSWPEGGLQALRVLFPGQSQVPLYLAVSPNPQLLRSITAVGQDRLFTITRSFVTNIVASHNGAESVIAGAHILNENIEEASKLALKGVRALIEDYKTGLDQDLQETWSREPAKTQSSSLCPPVKGEGLHVHICDGPFGVPAPGGFPMTSAFRVQWQQDLVLAEGYNFLLAESCECSAIVFFLERFLSLLRTTDNRRIGDLSSHTRITEPG